MAPPSRRVAFSAKAKKKQLQNKREVNRENRAESGGDFLEKRMSLVLFSFMLTKPIKRRSCVF